ncbi:MAG: hypothetical protein JXQ74_02090 [Alphaproteobacteria bacterium]|nr:hypothetical protein [Alphaproteobacteria bacterium]
MKKNLITMSIILMGFLVPFAAQSQQNDVESIANTEYTIPFKTPSKKVYKRYEKGRKRAIKKVTEYNESRIELAQIKKEKTLPGLEYATDLFELQIAALKQNEEFTEEQKTQMIEELRKGQEKIAFWTERTEKEMGKLKEISL